MPVIYSNQLIEDRAKKILGKPSFKPKHIPTKWMEENAPKTHEGVFLFCLVLNNNSALLA